MRKLIAAFKVSANFKFIDDEGMASWVDAWSEDYGLTGQIDACLLGGGMYPGYEGYWTAIRNHAPGEPLPMTGKQPTAAELAWAGFAAKTPHYVLSNTLTVATWPSTAFVRTTAEIAELKRQPGKDIYCVGGGSLAATLIEAGLIDEIRLLVYPLLVGGGQALFATLGQGVALQLLKAEQRANGIAALSYRIP